MCVRTLQATRNGSLCFFGVVIIKRYDAARKAPGAAATVATAATARAAATAATAATAIGQQRHW